MSFSIGKNELKKLQSEEKAIEEALKKTKSLPNNTYNFSDLILSKRRTLIHNKIAILKYTNPSLNEDENTPA